MLPFWTLVAIVGLLCIAIVIVAIGVYCLQSFVDGWQSRDTEKTWWSLIALLGVVFMVVYLTRFHLGWPPDYKEPVAPTPQIIIVTATPMPTGTPEF